MLQIPGVLYYYVGKNAVMAGILSVHDVPPSKQQVASFFQEVGLGDLYEMERSVSRWFSPKGARETLEGPEGRSIIFRMGASRQNISPGGLVT